MKSIQILVAVGSLGITQALHAAANTPIDSPQRAARSALYLVGCPTR